MDVILYFQLLGYFMMIMKCETVVNTAKNVPSVSIFCIDRQSYVTEDVLHGKILLLSYLFS